VVVVVVIKLVIVSFGLEGEESKRSFRLIYCTLLLLPPVLRSTTYSL